MESTLFRKTAVLLCFLFLVNLNISYGTGVTCGSFQCVEGDQCCSDISTGFRCYNPSSHTCVSNGDNQQVLCGAQDSACGNYCYDPNLYCCRNGLLVEKSLCEEMGSTSTGSPTTGGSSITGGSSTSGGSPLMCGSSTCYVSSDLCCADVRTGFTCYNPSTHVCAQIHNGLSLLCPSGHSGCNTHCYNTSQYCCENGNLRQIEFCQSGSTTGAGTTTGGGQQVTCGSRTCAVGEQCCENECFNPQQSTCFATTSGQVAGKYMIVCPLGQAPCGQNCYNPDTHICQKVEFSFEIAARPSPTITCGNTTCGQNQVCCEPTLSFQTTAQPRCFDPRTEVCCVHNYRTLGHVCSILPNGFAEQCCSVGSSGSPTQTFVPTCFDPTQQYCCLNGGPGGSFITLCDDNSQPSCGSCRCTNHC